MTDQPNLREERLLNHDSQGGPDLATPLEKHPGGMPKCRVNATPKVLTEL